MMSTVHFQPITYTVRMYETEAEFGKPFIGVATVQQIGQNTVFLSALCGTMSRQHLRDMALWGQEHGIKFVLSQRKGVIKQYKVEDFL